MGSYLTEHYNLICIYDCGKPMSDEQRRPVLYHLPHRTQDDLEAHKKKKRAIVDSILISAIVFPNPKENSSRFAIMTAWEKKRGMNDRIYMKYIAKL